MSGIKFFFTHLKVVKYQLLNISQSQKIIIDTMVTAL